MKLTNYNKPVPKKKIAALVIAVLVAIVVGLLLYNYFHTDSPAPAASVTAPEGGNLAPATEEEKQETEDHKDQVLEEQQKPTPTLTTPSGKKQATVVITRAATDTVNAYVTGVFEEGGTCTATFTQGSSTITRTSEGFQNASYTQCAPISPNLPSEGSWSVIVSYSSAAAEGSSKAQTL